MLLSPQKSNKRIGLGAMSGSVVINTMLVVLVFLMIKPSASDQPNTLVVMPDVFMPRERVEKTPPEQAPAPKQVLQADSAPPPPLSLNIELPSVNSDITLPDLSVEDIKVQPNLQRLSIDFSPKSNADSARVTTSVTLASPVFQAPLQYPMQAKQRGIEGFVTLALLIDTDGRVKETKVVEESPAGVFTSSATRGVLRWKFVSPEQEEWQRYTIRYRLEK